MSVVLWAWVIATILLALTMHVRLHSVETEDGHFFMLNVGRLGMTLACFTRDEFDADRFA